MNLQEYSDEELNDLEYFYFPSVEDGMIKSKVTKFTPKMVSVYNKYPTKTFSNSNRNRKRANCFDNLEEAEIRYLGLIEDFLADSDVNKTLCSDFTEMKEKHPEYFIWDQKHHQMADQLIGLYLQIMV